MDKKNGNLQQLIEQNKTASVPECTFCAVHRCRECIYLEIDNDYYNDGTRRCKYKGRWVGLMDEACWNFKQY